ncbi:MAG: ribosome maturation factor RimM [Dysgonamonadaceae bacterium]|jgi:16S rRNA processing protein RimM|nr:ribosome maturation factor RimM [Dysgonamonadaceae bacterium]
MIKREDLVKIGQFKKPHGVKGEIAFTFTNDSFDEGACPFLICEMDEIFVPFRVENCRFTSDSTAHILLKTIDSDKKARLLANKTVFFPKKHFKEEAVSTSFTWDYFIGFELIDQISGWKAKIIDIDETTINTLFIVEKDGEEILIPAAEEMIVRIDEPGEKLFVELPEGLID